jgi:8-oxo-dGTP diphosphatase
MHTFKDYYHNSVELSFDINPFSNEPKHVWVITRYKDKWLLTEHRRRGYEFPGGKVEEGETAEQAAIREVFEETGGIVKNLTYVGQYRVTGKDKIIIKSIFFADVEELEKQEHYFETKGPILLSDFPLHIKKDRRFSFIMRDEVFALTFKKLGYSLGSNNE